MWWQLVASSWYWPLPLCPSTPEPSIRRVWPTVVPAQCRMTSLVCRNGRHLWPKYTKVDRLLLWQLLTPIYISHPNVLYTWTLTTWMIFQSCSSVYLHMTNSTSEAPCHKVWNFTFIQFRAMHFCTYTGSKHGVHACQVVTSQHSAGGPR